MIPDDYSKVALLDLEGTLAEGHSWPMLHRLHGMDDDEFGQLYGEYHDGQLDFDGWLDALAERWKEGDVSREEIDEALEDSLTIKEGSTDLVDELKDRGFYTVMISGAPDRYSSLAASEVDAHTDIETVSLQYDDGSFTGFEHTRYRHKERLVEDIRDDDMDEIWAFGNGSNDVNMVEAADRAFMVPNSDNVDYERLEVHTGEPGEFLEVIRDEPVR